MRILLWTIGGLACVTALGWTGNAALQRLAEARSARQEYENTAGQLAELKSLRNRSPVFSAADVPGEDLTRRVTRAINSAGLPTATLSSLTPEADQPASSARTQDNKPLYLRRSARLTLDAVTLPQLGRFLEAWRAAEPGWVVSSIDLSSTPTPTSGSGAGSRVNAVHPANRELPLRVLLTIEAVVAAETPTAQAPHSQPGTGSPKS